MNEHESGFLALLTEQTRRRMHTLLELGPKRRADAREYLNHVEFDPRWRTALKGQSSAKASVLDALRLQGAPATCYVLCRDRELDGLTLPLEDAIDAAQNNFEGTFISCTPGRLGYYDGPGIKFAYLIERR